MTTLNDIGPFSGFGDGLLHPHSQLKPKFTISMVQPKKVEPPPLIEDIELDLPIVGMCTLDHLDFGSFDIEQVGDDIAHEQLIEGYIDPSTAFRNILMPMIRRIMPSLIASEIVGVQPMTGPVGLIHTMKNRFSDNDVGSMYPSRIDGIERAGRLFDGWNETKKALLEGLDGQRKSILDDVLENQRAGIKSLYYEYSDKDVTRPESVSFTVGLQDDSGKKLVSPGVSVTVTDVHEWIPPAGIKKGELHMIQTGRQTGKSMMVSEWLAGASTGKAVVVMDTEASIDKDPWALKQTYGKEADKYTEYTSKDDKGNLFYTNYEPTFHNGVMTGLSVVNVKDPKQNQNEYRGGGYKASRKQVDAIHAEMNVMIKAEPEEPKYKYWQPTGSIVKLRMLDDGNADDRIAELQAAFEKKQAEQDEVERIMKQINDLKTAMAVANDRRIASMRAAELATEKKLEHPDTDDWILFRDIDPIPKS
jgi:hypothetical protein